MIKKNLYIMIAVLMCLNACQDDGHIIIRDEGKPIYLSASLEGKQMTRSPYAPGGTEAYSSPTPEYPLHTDVWASTTPYLYNQEFNDDGKPLDGSGSDEKVAIHTDAKFLSGDPQLLRAAIYPKQNTVSFVAFSPISNETQKWKDEGGKYALYTFDGNDDVMFAPQVQGTYATDFSKSPTLSYHHLLTWLRIEMKAESKEVADSWGKISSMTIRSNRNVKINLQDEAYADGAYDFDSVSYSDEIDMPFYRTIEEESYDGAQVTLVKKYTDHLFQDAVIPYLQTEEMAYVLCAPVVGTDKKVVDGVDVDAEEYVISIVTDKRTVNIPVNLRHLVDGVEKPFLGSTRCTQFTLTLNFKMGNTIYLTSSVQDWEVGGLVVGNIGDKNIQ